MNLRHASTFAASLGAGCVIVGAAMWLHPGASLMLVGAGLLYLAAQASKR